MSKYLVSLSVQAVVEANSPDAAEKMAWAQRATLLATAKPDNITAAQVIRRVEDDENASVTSCPSESDVIARAIQLAKEATNGWACVATRNFEHDEIARLHREIDALVAGRQAPATAPKQRPTIE